MVVNFTIVNIIVLFGALQGFLLCWVLYKKRAVNLRAARFLILFLFSLSFLNLDYALMDMKVLDAYKPLYLFPFPYKYILGPALFLYIRTSTWGHESSNKRWLFLFLPAATYGILRCFWFCIAAYENSYRIVAKLVVSDFFRVNEFVYLLFTSTILIYALRWLKRINAQTPGNKLRHTSWFRLFTLIFLCLIIINFALSIIDLIIHNGDDTMLFNYPHLIINSAFIYWIGYVGLLKPTLLLFSHKKWEDSMKSDLSELIAKKLSNAMKLEELYRDKDLSLSTLSQALGVPAKDISVFINNELGTSFPEYLNHLRVEKVKQLITSPDADRYTIVALAETAGFKSKSAFHASFKRIVGLTPSAYKKQPNSV